MSRYFPDWIKAYCDLLEGKTEAPRRFHFWSAVSCIAGALTRRVVLDEISFRYFPNFYILLVSPPGILKKTSTIDLAFEFLRRLSEETEHITIGPDMTTVEGLCNYLATLKNQVAVSHNGQLVDDAAFNDQCACTLQIGEFGSLYRNDNTALINLLTDLYDCREIPLWKHTKTQGDDVIVNPFVNIIAGTTPQFLQDEFNDKVSGWGLSSRMIFIFAGRKERSIYRPSKFLSGSDYRETREKLYEDLKQVAQLAGEYNFSTEADRFAENWYVRNDAETAEYVAREHYDEWVAQFRGRKQVHFHKLAMILSAARRDTLVITLDDVRDAAAQIERIEEELPQVFEKKMSPTQAALTEQQIIDKIILFLAKGPKPRNEVVTSASHFVDSMTAIRLIESAIARRVLTQDVRVGSGSWLRNGHAPEED